MRSLLFLFALTAGSAYAYAQAPVIADDLPPADIVLRVLETQPSISVAQARREAARAEREALRRGPHEVTAEASVGRRSIELEGEYAEFDATISRTFRRPGKADLDRQAGLLGVELAESRISEARRDAALALVELWYAWLEAGELHRNAVELVQNHHSLVEATGRRAQLRDAAELELEQAYSALAMAEVEAERITGERERTRALLEAHFPDLPLPAEPPRLGDPLIAFEALEDIRLQIIALSPEIEAASRAADREQVLARRARAEGSSDPTFGVRVFSDRGGAEHGAALVASIPIGGGYRRAVADEAAAQANAAFAERVQIERVVTARATADIAELRALLSMWRVSRDAVVRAERSAELSARGQELGATDLSDRLYAGRQANEARALEISARANAAALVAKVKIDAQLLWAE